MSVTIRMQRRGRKNTPYYRIVVTDTQQRRSGKYLEALGSYDPVAKKETLAAEERYTFWLQKGAQFSTAVEHLVKRHYPALVVAQGVREAK